MLDKIVEILETHGNFDIKGKCLDCQTPVLVSVDRLSENQIQIKGGALFEPKPNFGYAEQYVFKCDDCFQKDPKIYQRNEVYTRVVGYLRPTSQMNAGKISEIEQRAMFHIPDM